MAGAGIVGIEIVSELAVKYAQTNEKKIGICLRGDKVLSGLPSKASQIAADFLVRNNVQVHYKTPFTETTAKELGYDLVIPCLGYKYHT